MTVLLDTDVLIDVLRGVLGGGLLLRDYDVPSQNEHHTYSSFLVVNFILDT